MAFDSEHRSMAIPFQNSGGGGPISSLYSDASSRVADDYEGIKSGYDSLLNRAKNGQLRTPANYVPVNSTSIRNVPGATYNRSGDLNSLVGNLQNFSDTGGYSGGDIDSIRARGLSPIRAAYANAQRNLSRQKNLQGGYMPNMGAITSKMAREQGELGSTMSTNINAEVAKMVAAGKLSGMQSLSPILTGENTMQNQISQKNADTARETEMYNMDDERRVRDLNANMKMRTDERNTGIEGDNAATELSALSGKTNLFGTTPAMTNTFNNQVLQNQTANQIKNQRAGFGGVAVPRFG